MSFISDKFKYVGERIKEERQKYGLSLKELEEATGLSSSFLSLLENGKTVPSLKALDKLTSFFSIHIASLFAENVEKNYVYFNTDNQIQINEDGNKKLKFLLPKSNSSCINPVIIELDPGTVDEEYSVHNGVEFGYVITGEIIVDIKKGDNIHCRQGDSIIYRADLEHRLMNRQEDSARGIWIGFSQVNDLLLNQMDELASKFSG